jgi:rhodanese-related sulfurtransferase
MSVSIDRDEVGRLADAGARLVDVLPAESYERLHLPGALNLPLGRLSREAVAGLDRDAALIVYCYDHQ